MKKNFSSLLASLLLGCTISAQVGINTAEPQGSLDVAYVPSKPTSPQGILFPKMTGDEIQAMTLTTQQNGLFVFATSVPTSQIARTSLITESGLYYYFAPDDKWRNVNQVINPSSLFSTGYTNTTMAADSYSPASAGLGGVGFHTPGKTSYIVFRNGTPTPFNSSPFIVERTSDTRRGIRFLKSGIYSVTIQFSLTYRRYVNENAPDGTFNSEGLPARLGSQITYRLEPNFLTSDPTAYTSNITHNIDYQLSGQGSGLSRISGIAVGNIIVKQDNAVELIPQIWSTGYWLSPQELNDTGFLNLHVTRVSDYTP